MVLDDWMLKREANGRFHTRTTTEDFALDLTFTITQAAVLQGDNGYARKSPTPGVASYYYSLPHLEVSGAVLRGGRTIKVTGSAWFDHEWASNYLDPKAVGWDWLGLNLDDGGALMVGQIRSADGAALWGGGSLRSPDGKLTLIAPNDFRLTTLRRWHSPHTGGDYPVERVLSIRLPIGERQWRIKPLFDDQELDSRAAGGPVYWEGAVQVEGGRGYLELTGYLEPLRM